MRACLQSCLRAATVLVLAFGIIDCGSSSPTTPTAPSIPQVAGNYSGTAIATFPELNTSITFSASTTVTQSGSTVNFAPLVLKNSSYGTLSIPLGQATIDTTGAIDGGSTQGSYYESSCGGTYNFTGSGGFFGRELRLSFFYTSTTNPLDHLSCR